MICDISQMWIFLLLFGTLLSIPERDFHSRIYNEELSLIDNKQQVVEDNKKSLLTYLFDEDKPFSKIFLKYARNGLLDGGQTFNIYDDDIRLVTISLFRIMLDFRYNNKTKYKKLLEWANHNINPEMIDYTRRLVALFSARNKEEKFLPPFIAKPNYFVNGETIYKALYMKRNIETISDDVMKIYQIYKINGDVIIINTNYSQWNGPFGACDELIKYFTEDVALNSYYYGLHLLHPFWMSNEELSELNPRHAEHYYYANQQLYARYLLEKEHLDINAKLPDSTCELDYNPYLYYENGLPFPTRSSLIGRNIQSDLAYLKSIDTAIKECIHRGMENGTYIKITEENYIDLLAKLIRANYDGIKATKIIRSLFGYGYNGYPSDKPNPAPSVLNHPQTTLREPIYWFLMRTSLDYFSEYSNKTEPYNIAEYETDEFVILEANFSRVSSNFKYFFIDLHKSLESDKTVHIVGSTPNIFARQRRLNTKPFSFKFTLVSKTEKVALIRLFLGPRCNIKSCVELHNRFFQLDCYKHKLSQGINTLTWNPESSSRYSDDGKHFSLDYNNEQNYDIFKFPKNLIIPKGLEKGLNLTLFIMVLDNDEISDVPSDVRLYNEIVQEISPKSLGFPFHRKTLLFNEFAPNYRFYNITVFHEKIIEDKKGYFSSYLI